MERDHSIVQNIKPNEDRKANFYCDLMLESSDGKRFPVHKSILATFPYFRLKIENEGLSKSFTNGKIYFKNITGNQLEIVINYVYTGEVHISEYNETKALYETGLLIESQFLKDYSTNKIIESISMPFALEYWIHAANYKIESLKTECLKFIAEKPKLFFDNFLSTLKNEEFLQIIENRKQFQLTEIDFYRIVRRWICLDYDLRKLHVESILLKEVDYCKIETKIIKEEILKDEKLRSHSEFVVAIFEIIFNNSNTSQETHPTISSTINFSSVKDNKPLTSLKNDSVPSLQINSKSSTNLRRYSGKQKMTCSPENSQTVPQKQLKLYNPNNLPVSINEKTLYLINRDKLEIHEVNFESRNISLKYKNPSVEYNSYSTCNITCNNNECILISGGKNDLPSLKYNKVWNPQSADISIELPNLQRARIDHKVLFLNDKIYACGGRNDRGVTKSTEIYDFGSSSWIDGPDFVEAKLNFGLTSSDNSLYAIGSDCASVVERLDPRDSKNKWQKISSGICPHYIERCIPLSDHTILCTDKFFYNSSIFDTRNCKFGSYFVTPTKNKRMEWCDLFKLDNIIHSYYKEWRSENVYIYKYDKNKGWFDSEIKLASTITHFDLITLEK